MRAQDLLCGFGVRFVCECGVGDGVFGGDGCWASGEIVTWKGESD